GDEEWDEVLVTNLTSMFRCARAVAPGMIERKRGKIINVGSMYGVLGVPRYAAYCASKAAVDGLTRSLAAEWARHGLQVNCLAPGYMNTDIPRAAMADPKTRERFLSKIPARRIGEPTEAAALAVYMASSAADFLTGQTIYLDGGQTTAWWRRRPPTSSTARALRMELNLKGKSVIVTGGGSNIGRAISLAFAREGAHVTIAEIDTGQGEKTAAEARRAGAASAVVARTDVTKWDSVQGT